MPGVRVERLDHLRIVAGVCREIGLSEYLDRLAGPSQQQASVGTATVAMILNGLGFSNRRLYLISQFFATKPVEHLLGASPSDARAAGGHDARPVEWEEALWHLSNQRFACEPDAHAALAQQLTPRPEWLTVHARLVPHPKQHRPGRSRQGTLPDRIARQIQATDGQRG